MFKIGDIIIYGSQGACRVEDIGVPDISGIIQGKLYYTLSPIFVDGKIFIPVDTTIYMRPIITKEEAENIITQIPNIDTGIVENQNYKIMEDHYKKLLATHDCMDLILLIKSIYNKQQNVKMQGKNIGQTDEKFRKIAEDLLHSEFSIALEIPKSMVSQYIASSVEQLTKGSLHV
ncbi:CarD family transcriptional regulator [Aminipila sp.]|jgi:CarD family transcriptional regulator|uniref:CarD family transcriptional regulator n=1 Tax=Aminipila sp. TaxID=2060095 RepID=UPI00289A4C31|nr:CarD family transcriptional regulator [Aminipila sp.]